MFEFDGTLVVSNFGIGGICYLVLFLIKKCLLFSSCVESRFLLDSLSFF